MAFTELQPDKLFDHRYEILEELGRGSFAQVCLAQDRILGDRFVIKKLIPTFKAEEHRERAINLFKREAMVLYRLRDYPQIPQFFGYDHEKYYLIEELIEGHELSVETKEQWSERQVFIFLKDVLQTLEVVHQNKFIHRDLNPRNLMRRKSDGKIIMIDFGTVTIDADDKSAFAGTPKYTAPEQMNGDSKINSDIYSVGLMAIQFLTGKEPKKLKQNDQSEFMWKDQIAINPKLASIITKMVKDDYRDRQETAQEVLTELNQLQISDIPEIAVPEPQSEEELMAAELNSLLNRRSI